ncbi:hypothetical protein Agub_g3005 [Astrephomene gubernaculifera]|uniref:Uncharacterized protein n=1 Tax=Astrephomene gubernaculifera TaxID=47775 RepID=A0AAD3HIQ9_9CHLO|nr:hypothetical protein Agub_g3005 [Astrephomene gubernaculifera]
MMSAAQGLSLAGRAKQEMQQRLWNIVPAAASNVGRLSRLMSTATPPQQGAASGEDIQTRAERMEVGSDESPEELEARKRRALQSYLEQQLGGGEPDRASLAVLLQRHGVVVRGGQQQALELMSALMAWKRGEWKADV